MEEKIDDGTLSFLNIDISKDTRHFNCDVTTQSKIVNKTFYVIDFITDMKTKHGDGRYLVKIRTDLNQSDSESKKFFTNSNEIKLILNKIKEMDKFPRRVTLKSNGNIYFFE